MNEETRRRFRSRVNRIAGQVGGIHRMLEEDRYCVDILNQISAVRSALDALGIELVTQHLETCVIGHGAGGDHPQAAGMTQDQLLAEIRTALSRFLK